MAETLTIYPAAFDSDYSYNYVNSSYPTSNPIGQPSSNTTYVGVYLTTGASAETYFYYDFDLSDLPAGVTINSVSCTYKAYISTTSSSNVTARSVQMYSGSTAKGSSNELTATASERVLSVGTWTYDELQNARIRLYAKRGTSRTTSSYHIRFYGATLTVEYEDNATIYTVTVESNGTTTDAGETNEVREGKPFSVAISGTVNSITDNGADVRSQLVEQASPDSESVTAYPASYTVSGSISGTKYTGAIGYGSDNTVSGNDYCGSSGSTASIDYAFDFSAIPSDATIQSVSVQVGGHCESTSNRSEVADLQLYSGSTAKGSKSSFTSTSKQVVTMSAGSWTRSELQQAKLRFTVGYYGGLVNGVDFVVVYSTPRSGSTFYVYTIGSVNENHAIVINAGETSCTRLRLKVNGSYRKVLKIYVKQGGSWVLTDESAVDTNARYIVKGG